MTKKMDAQDVTERFILNFKFKACEREILKTIYEIRIISTDDLTDILGRERSYVQTSLSRLYTNGFLYRIKLTKDQGAASNGAVYWMLDRGGALFIAGAYGLTLKTINWNVRNNMIKFEKLAHAIKIGECVAWLNKAARSVGHEVESSYCDLHLRYEFTAEDEKKYVVPDLYLTYRDDKGNRYQYFFEIDMGTMPITGARSKTNVVVNKVPKYEMFFKSKEFKENFEVRPRIVFLTTNKTRAGSILEGIKNIRSTKLEFLITTFDIFKGNPLIKCLKSTNIDGVTNLFT